MVVQTRSLALVRDVFVSPLFPQVTVTETTTEAAPEPTFPQFGKLPFELQSSIWLIAAQTPRDIRLYRGSGRVRDLPDCTRRGRKFVGHRPPALLHTCRESRSVALKVYNKLGFKFDTSRWTSPLVEKRRVLYWNSRLDVLYVHGLSYFQPCFQCISLFQPPLTPIFAPIQHLKLDTRWKWDPSRDFRLRRTQSLLVKVRKFSKVEFLELVVKKPGSKQAIDTEMIQEALGNLDQAALHRNSIWPLVQVSRSTSRCPTSMNCLSKPN
jgi:hypothetical protein